MLPWRRTSTDLGLLLLRLAFGLTMAFGHGLGKVGDLGGFSAKVAARGFPAPWFSGPFAALSEFLGGLLVAAGLFSRSAALCLLGTMLGAALVVHARDPFGKKELALAYAVVTLVIVVAGPGRFSLDSWLSARRGRG